MSDATPRDLQNFLEKQLAELRHLVQVEQSKATEEFITAGRNGGAIHRAFVQAAGKAVGEHIDMMTAAEAGWVGPVLSGGQFREAVAGHLRRSVNSSLPVDEGLQKAVLGGAAYEVIRATSERLKNGFESRIRQFELGVRTAHSGSSVTYNIIHARDVNGGVQQAGRDATQHNVVTLEAERIAAAVEQLDAALRDFGYPAIVEAADPDLETLRIQLAKPEPSHPVIRETAKSLRTMIEGAVGGAIGGAATPAVTTALGALLAAVGAA